MLRVPALNFSQELFTDLILIQTKQDLKPSFVNFDLLFKTVKFVCSQNELKNLPSYSLMSQGYTGD